MTKYHTENWQGAMAAKRRLTPVQAAIVRKAIRVRRNLGNKVLAARFGVSPSTIRNYATGQHK